MSDEPNSEDPDLRGSVFGNLPGSRPGTRSPRREAAKTRAAGGKKQQAAGRQKQQAAGSRQRAKAETPRAAPKPRQPEQPSEGAGLEDLAWAGVAAAAEAATLGVRLASKAMEALRKPIDRR